MVLSPESNLSSGQKLFSKCGSVSSSAGDWGLVVTPLFICSGRCACVARVRLARGRPVGHGTIIRAM